MQRRLVPPPPAIGCNLYQHQSSHGESCPFQVTFLILHSENFHAVGWCFPCWDKCFGEMTERKRCAYNNGLSKNLLQLKKPLN